MADWVRNTVMLTVLAIWAIYIGVTTLVHGEKVDSIVWGVPAAAYIGLNPTWKKGNKDGPS